MKCLALILISLFIITSCVSKKESYDERFMRLEKKLKKKKFKILTEEFYFHNSENEPFRYKKDSTLIKSGYYLFVKKEDSYWCAGHYGDPCDDPLKPFCCNGEYIGKIINGNQEGLWIYYTIKCTKDTSPIDTIYFNKSEFNKNKLIYWKISNPPKLKCFDDKRDVYEIEKRKEDSINNIKKEKYRAIREASKLKEAQRIKDSIQNAIKPKKKILKKKK
jgi:hypothetical protein